MDVSVLVPTPEETLKFIRPTFPILPAADAVILRYVEKIQLGDSSDAPWVTTPGWGWKKVRVGTKHLLFLGCEFSYWGDIAGHVVDELFMQGVTNWVLYVGKLGTMNANVRPNQMLATGTTSIVNDQLVCWDGFFSQDLGNSSSIIPNTKHITVDSVMEETLICLNQSATGYDLVDPEIGHMGKAAYMAGGNFDYLHLVTDCLTQSYGVGLFNERYQHIISKRIKLLKRASLSSIHAILSK